MKDHRLSNLLLSYIWFVMTAAKNLLAIHDDKLSAYEYQKVLLLNKISLYCILFALLFDVTYLIAERYPQIAIVTGAIGVIFVPTILIQKKGYYMVARMFFSVLLLSSITATSFFNINRGEFLLSHNMLIVLAPMFVILFERKLKIFLYYLTMVIFFFIHSYDYSERFGLLDKMFFSSSMIYLIVWLGIYYFVNSYKNAFYRIYLNQGMLIDQLASQKRSLEQTNATKNKLFSIVAHDLKRPMNMLSGLLQMGNVIPEKEVAKYRKQVEDNVVGINALIENVLTTFTTGRV